MNMLQAGAYNTDKSEAYLEQYRHYFENLQNKPLTLLELGVLHGGSLQMWAQYFLQGTIIGLDIDKIELSDANERVHIYQGHQEDTKLLTEIATSHAPEGFDIIIDDASHIASYTKTSFWHLFQNHLKPGGVYVIEDWGTGYWPHWPDGRLFRSNHKKDEPKWIHTMSGSLAYYVRAAYWRSIGSFRSHQHGMVGLVKQLIDELAMPDISHEKFGTHEQISSPIKEMHFAVGQVFIIKR